MRFATMLAAAAALATFVIAPATSHAKDKQDSENRDPQVLADLKACQPITDSAQRLACYDRATVALIASADSGEVRMVDKEEAKAVRRSLFGFSLPRIALFGGGKEKGAEEEVKVLQTTVTRVRALPAGKFLFRIAEGDAEWQTTDAPMAMDAPRVGDKVTLERAALGSYWVKFDGQRAVKGKRVN